MRVSYAVSRTNSGVCTRMGYQYEFFQLYYIGGAKNSWFPIPLLQDKEGYSVVLLQYFVWQLVGKRLFN